MYLLGQNIQLYVGGISIAFAKDSQISISISEVDVSNKDHGGYSAFEAGLTEWNMQSSNLIGNKRSGHGFDSLLEIMLKKEPVDVVFGTKDVTVDRNDEYNVPEGDNGWPVPTKGGWKGKAILVSLDMSSPNGEVSTMNVTLKGCSPLTQIKAAEGATASTMSLPKTTTSTKA